MVVFENRAAEERKLQFAGPSDVSSRTSLSHDGPNLRLYSLDTRNALNYILPDGAIFKLDRGADL
jgi:hypothetical protein